jgi:thiamine pyrophosphate-dependent acetolactate synthase large subunit-like protein
MMSEPEITRIVDAALTRFASGRPVPSTVTIPQAAEMLDVSTRTIHRMKPPRVGAKIPYSWVLKQLEGK